MKRCGVILYNVNRIVPVDDLFNFSQYNLHTTLILALEILFRLLSASRYKFIEFFQYGVVFTPQSNMHTTVLSKFLS